MTQHTHLGNEELTAKLQQIEKSIGQADSLRQRALMRKDILDQQINESIEELKASGTTPEQAEAELAKISTEIKESLEKIDSLIPYHLIKKYEGLV